MVRSVNRFITLLSLAIGFCLPQLVAQEYVGGLMNENTTFSPSFNPYIVIEPLIIPAGVTLTIEPGTEVFFMITTSINVEGGTLIARGLEDQTIQFNAQTDKKWDGIKFSVSRSEIDDTGNYISGSILEYVSINQTTTSLVLGDTAKLFADHIRITNGDYGVYLQSGSTLHLHHSIIDQCSYGMYVKNSGANLVDGCIVSNCDIGIFFPSNNISRYNRITNNNLSYNTNIALFMSIGQGSLQYNVIQGNTVSYNNIGLHIGNGGTDDLGYNLIASNIVQHNDIGIKLSQDADTMRANIIEMNATGLLLTKASNNQLIYNIIQNNSAWGLTLTDGSNGNLFSTNSLNNNFSGIKVTQKDFKYSIDNTFIYNSLNGNLNEAFLFEAGPQQPLVANSIIGTHSTGVFVNHFETDIIAQGNWWGTTDTTAIDSLIIDFHDQEVYGEVIYKPVLDYPDPESPISRPQQVVKRLIGTQVKVDWINNTEADLAGYRIYYGNQGENGFNGSFDVGTDTTYVLDNLSLFDPVAVTAYDTDADGLIDQPEGHESAYSYALAGPYAGDDAGICQGEIFNITSATALGDQNIQWTTSGDGVFDNSGLLTASYSPGQNDIAAGLVFLTLSLTSSGLVITDEMELRINGFPFLFAGNDTTVNQHDSYNTNQAIAGNYSAVNWTSKGDGVFEESEVLHTQYQPGVGDILSGAVQLILNLQSGCGNLSDTLLLVIVPSYNISGKVHKGEHPVSDGVIIAIKTGSAGAKAVSTVNTLPDGTFYFINLATGNYFLYALSDPELNKTWAPAYYAESEIWQTAYLIPLITNVYDVDIDLYRITDELPAGNGEIAGFFNYFGKTGDDDSIYRKPWFSGSFFQSGSNLGLPAANHVVLLMSTDLSRVLGWTLTASDGSFHFDQLPFGSYRLWGEKAGFTNSLSPIITLSPSNDEIEGVQLTVSQKSIDITLPPGENFSDNLNLYPNPASDRVWLSSSVSGMEAPVVLSFYNSSGRLIQQETLESLDKAVTEGIDLSGLQTGIYMISLVSNRTPRRFMKLSIVR